MAAGNSATTADALESGSAWSSPLQLRAVRMTRSGTCASPRTQLSADQPVTLPNGHGACADLDPSWLTVTHARAALDQATPHSSVVRITFDAADSATFDRVGATYTERQIAFVMFGRILATPVVWSGQLDGTALLPGLDPLTASNLVTALNA